MDGALTEDIDAMLTGEAEHTDGITYQDDTVIDVPGRLLIIVKTGQVEVSTILLVMTGEGGDNLSGDLMYHTVPIAYPGGSQLRDGAGSIEESLRIEAVVTLAENL